MYSSSGGMEYMKGDGAWKGEISARPSQHGMRRSCDACGRKKKRCDGERPCSRCFRSAGHCVYSKRRWHQPDRPLHRHKRQPQRSHRDAVHVKEHQLRPTPVDGVKHHLLPLKRCRLRASPATGLVGMRENAFLSDFFGCVGFLPLANESQIRETMVKIMVPVASQEESPLGTDSCGEDGAFGTPSDCDTFGDVLAMDRPPQDPSFSTFWSAIALGALVKGCPFDAVDSYSQQAGEALAACRSSSTNAELAKTAYRDMSYARASAILTSVYSCMGDMEKFREYLEVSEYFLQKSIERGSTDAHAGLRDLLLHYRKVANVQDGPMDSSWAHEEGLPQLDKAATGYDLYRFVAQSFRAFDQAVYAKGRERCAGDLEQFYSCGPSHRSYDPNDPLPGEVSEAIAAVFETTNSLDFEALQEAADRPSIRAGVGDLLINGALVFETAAKGDLPSVLEKLDRSIEVYERYPGLCRCMMGRHMSHMLLATLATIKTPRARGMYDRLRGAFNSCRASHSMPIPPLNEWQGMAAICSDLNCRAMETLMRSEHMKAFTTLSVKAIQKSAVLAQTASDPERETQIEFSTTSVAHGEIADLVQPSAISSWTGPNGTCKCPRNQNLSGLCGDGAALLPLASRPYSSSRSDKVSTEFCVLDGVSTKALHALAGSTRIGEDHEESADPEEDDVIAAADWLEVTHAMLDAAHTP